MEKIYRFINATVHIQEPTAAQIENIHNATELYLTRLVQKGCFDGNNNKAGTINEK